ncbi:MAG: 2-oxo acid dehydrogenase subunit E2 [Armatimonadetes bacterium]|nr:2-oxo acid dehydrogenase subunit E2 [Armatimonadota bacterium]
MKQTVILPAHRFPEGVSPLVAVVERWEKTLGQAVMAGDALATLRAGTESFAVVSPAFGVLTKKCALPGEAIEAGEPLAILGGVSAPLAETVSEPFAAPPVYVPDGAEMVHRLSPAESAVAAHHARSRRETPHGFCITVADVSEALRLIERTERGETVSGASETLTLLPFVLCAVARSLTRFPAVNAERIGTDEIRRKQYVHIGVETRFEGDLIVPVVRDSDRKSVLGAAREWARLEQKIATGTLERADVSGATFTVSHAPNVLWRSPVLHTPLAGHLCFGKTLEKRIYLGFAFDERVAPEGVAEAFLADVADGLGASGFLFA